MGNREDGIGLHVTFEANQKALSIWENFKDAPINN